jgi:K+-sensing histidine kinase KdpD
MKPTFDTPDQAETIHNLITPLAIIRAHSEHLLAAYDRLSPPQRVALLEAIQSQTILLEHLLDGLTNKE